MEDTLFEESSQEFFDRQQEEVNKFKLKEDNLTRIIRTANLEEFKIYIEKLKDYVNKSYNQERIDKIINQLIDFERYEWIPLLKEFRN